MYLCGYDATADVIDGSLVQGIAGGRQHAGHREQFGDVDVVVPLVELVFLALNGV
jgi:hypothetical protein